MFGMLRMPTWGKAPAADARRRLRGLLQAKPYFIAVVAAETRHLRLAFDRVVLGIRPAAVDVSIKLETKAVPSVNRFGECEVYVKYQAAAWQNVPSTVIHFAWSIDDQQYQDEHSGDFEWVNPSSSPTWSAFNFRNAKITIPRCDANARTLWLRWTVAKGAQGQLVAMDNVIVAASQPKAIVATEIDGVADEDKPFLRQILAYYVSLYKPEYLFATCEDDNARIQRAGKVNKEYGGGGERSRS